MEVARRLRNTNTLPENGSALSLARHNSASESMPLRKSTASTATRIRICGVICSMPTQSQKCESARPVGWFQWPSTPAAVSHLAAILLRSGSSPSHRSRMRPALQMPARPSLFASVATSQVWAAAVAGGDRPTSASSAYQLPVPAPWHPSHPAGPTPPLQPTVLPAAALEPHACLATPQIAAVTALNPHDTLPIPVPRRSGLPPLAYRISYREPLSRTLAGNSRRSDGPGAPPGPQIGMVGSLQSDQRFREDPLQEQHHNLEVFSAHQQGRTGAAAGGTNRGPA